MQETKLPNVERTDALDNKGNFTIEYLLTQASDYLTLGIDELFISHASTERCHFLLVLQRLLQRLLEQVVLPEKDDSFIEGLYQVESLSRLAADLIFLEDEDGDKVNYLIVLRDLLMETRDLYEKEIRY